MAQDLIVFSHMPWDAGFQRPWQLITRLARDRRIFYFEAPVSAGPAGPVLQCHEAHPNVFICQPATPVEAAGFHDLQLPYLRDLLEELIQRFEIQEWAVWFYTPLALPLIYEAQPTAVIYDRLDDLVAEHGSSTQLLQREAALLKMADVVFTCSRRLYDATRQRHPRVHYLPNSVDAEHFSRARQAVSEPVEQARLARPRLGYFGVIDERIDMQLLEALARAHPEWQLILVGPVVQIDPDQLPLLSNIYYFGHQDYADLPRFLAGWDLCLLPLAVNPSTRYINPRKVLEYMLAERPIVSTPIADLAESYGEVLYLGDSPDTFIEACEKALNASREERKETVGKMRELLSRSSWDSTATSIAGLISSAIQERTVAKSSRDGCAEAPILHPLPNDGNTVPILHERVRSVPVAVVGAGATGLSAAFHLGDAALLIDQNNQVGGNYPSFAESGFLFDYSGPRMFSADDSIREMYELLLGDNVHWQDRNEWIFRQGKYILWPFHEALHGLPADIIHDCLLGAIEARLGPVNGAGETSAGRSDSAGPTVETAGNATHAAPRPVPSASNVAWPFRNRRRTPRNHEDSIYANWGSGIARHFALPWYSKLWATPLRELEPSPERVVPKPDLDAMLKGALMPVPPTDREAPARTGYPLQGGLQALMDGFVPRLSSQLQLGHRIVAIAPAERLLTLDDGSLYHYESLISTLPLPELMQLLEHALPEPVREAVHGLRYLSLRWVSLGIGRDNLTDKLWIDYPGDTVFHRVFAQGNASPECSPAGGFGLSCEIAYSDQQPLPWDGKALTGRCIHDCIRVGLLRAADPIRVTHQVDIPNAALIPDHNSGRYLKRITTWLIRHGIALAGQDDAWSYQDGPHPLLVGRDTARRVLEHRERHSATG